MGDRKRGKAVLLTQGRFRQYAAEPEKLYGSSAQGTM